jgi:hypothetical protein
VFTTDFYQKFLMYFREAADAVPRADGFTDAVWQGG